MTDPKKADFPREIVEQLKNFSEAVLKAQEILLPLMRNNIKSSALSLTPLDRARLNLTCGYALSSLFWMYLSTLGLDPRKYGVADELGQYKEYMLKLQEITSKKREGPRIDKEAAHRFVKGSLWEPKKKSHQRDVEEHSSDEDEDEQPKASTYTIKVHYKPKRRKRE